MDKKKNQIVTIFLLLIVMSISSVSYANNWEEWMKGIEIQTIDSNNNNLNFDYSNKNRPATWGDLIRILKEKGDESGEQKQLHDVLGENYKNKLPLVVTKVEVSQVFKTLIEIKNKQMMNRTSVNILNQNIGNISKERNYLNIDELEYLFNNMSQFEVQRGMVREIKVGKLIELLPDGKRGVFDIIEGTNVKRLTLPLEINTPWENKNGTYEIVVENGKVISLKNNDEFKYGFVKNSREGLLVGETKIDLSNQNNLSVKSGDYIEYIENEAIGLIVTKNFKKPKTYIVNDVNENSVNTFENKIFDGKYDYITIEGIKLSLKDIKKNNILFEFEDNNVLVASNSKEEEFSYIGETLSINGVMYKGKDVLITDGDFMSTLGEWEYSKLVSKGEVVRDLFNTPIMVKVPKVYHNIYVQDIDKDKVSFSSTSEIKDIDLNDETRRLSKDEFYDLVILNEKVHKIEKSKTVKDEISNLVRSSIVIDKVRYLIHSNLSVVIDKTDVIDYTKLIEEYKDKISEGYMEVEAVVNNREVVLLRVNYIPILKNDRDNYLPKSDFYRVESIEHRGKVTLITLSVDGSRGVFTYNRYLSKSYEGADVEVEFNRDGTIKYIR